MTSEYRKLRKKMRKFSLKTAEYKKKIGSNVKKLRKLKSKAFLKRMSVFGVKGFCVAIDIIQNPEIHPAWVIEKAKKNTLNS